MTWLARSATVLPMKIRVGLGIANFPFSDARAFWRWIERCEDSTVDSIWQTDRLVTSIPQLELMTTMAALAGATRWLEFGMNVRRKYERPFWLTEHRLADAAHARARVLSSKTS
jgi:alkanesulfonate monooxygenase SsuD/methylene tetrahydromethanopterin reductase-like flavin-dependent oxidoreductase (luciferase family)